MIFSGEFQTRERHNILVKFETGSGSSATSLIFSSDPVTIICNSDGIFAPIKPLSATVRIMTKDIVQDLYASDDLSVSCKITDLSDNKVLFFGYVTPCIYTQDYISPYEELEIECVSSLSTLEYYQYPDENLSVQSLKTILDKALSYTNHYNAYTVLAQLNTRTGIDNLHILYDILNRIFLNERNFRDDDGEMWNCKEVIEEICKVLGVSLVEENNELYLLDYTVIKEGRNLPYLYTPDDTILNPIVSTLYTLNKDSYLGEGMSVSLDNVYDAVNITCNQYEDKTATLNLFDDSKLTCIHPGLRYYSTYTDTPDKRIVDLYRFYVNSDYDFMMSPVTYTDGAFHVGTPVVFSNNTYSTNSNSIFKERFIDGVLGKNVMPIIVKHFRYTLSIKQVSGTGSSSDSLPILQVGNSPGVYKWETSLLWSYGITLFLNGDKYKDGDNVISSLTFVDFYRSFLISHNAYIVSKDNIRITPLSNGYKTFFKLKGSITQLGANMTSDVPIDLMFKKDNSNSSNASDEIKSSTSDYLYGQEAHGAIVVCKSDGTTAYIGNMIAQLSWGAIHDSADNFNIIGETVDMSNSYVVGLNVLDDKAQYTEIAEPYEGKIALRANCPGYYLNKDTKYWGKYTHLLYPAFLLISNTEMTVDRSYDEETWLNGKKPSDDVVYTNKTRYRCNNEFDLEIRLNTQDANFPISLSSLIDKDNKFVYDKTLYTDTKAVSKPIQLEQFLLNKYTNHYTNPKFIYTCTLTDKIAMYDIVYNKKMNKRFVIDYYEYEVINNRKTYNLIEL